MEDCIFCRIVEGKIEAVRIWEDSKHIAILDRNPNVEGQALVITKKHFDSYAFEMPDKDYGDLMRASKDVAKLLDRSFKVHRTAMVMEGLGINHIHIKLYPIHGLSSKFSETWPNDRVYFEKYEGYISTKLGPQKSIEELRKTAERIAKDNE
ncbi:MAG: HIT domain-containing protein [Candidatus Micrarchaeota archaeon]|nr:HIT domain-containing protein [Candidatus Micrarchaeota archaeon]